MVIDNIFKNKECITNLLAEIKRFIIVGSLAVIIQYLSYLFFLTWLKLSAVYSTTISYLISFIINFLLSNKFTFHTNPNTLHTLFFTLSHLINITLQTLLVAMLTLKLNPKISILVAMIICIPTNFILVRLSLKAKK